MATPTDAPARARCRWQPGPCQPKLPAGAVHVWRADLAAADERLADLLCAQERERAARLLSDRDRLLWTRARGVLRALLGRYLGLEPGALRFAVGERGKPALLDGTARLSDGTARLSDEAARLSAGTAAGGTAATLAFNLSHSGAVALYALSSAGEVGVDVEVERRQLDEPALAERVLGARQAARLRALADPIVRRREFLRAWTRHEAGVKCLGTGIGAGIAAGAPQAGGQTPWLCDLDLPDGAAGALACVRAPAELRCWSWSEDAASF